MLAGFALADGLGRLLLAAFGLQGASPISGVAVAIVLGLLLRNLLPLPATLGPGLKFCTTTVLRLGIVLVGIKLSVIEMARLGAAGVPVVLAAIATGLLLRDAGSTAGSVCRRAWARSSPPAPASAASPPSSRRRRPSTPTSATWPTPWPTSSPSVCSACWSTPTWRTRCCPGRRRSGCSWAPRCTTPRRWSARRSPTASSTATTSCCAWRRSPSSPATCSWRR